MTPLTKRTKHRGAAGRSPETSLKTSRSIVRSEDPRFGVHASHEPQTTMGRTAAAAAAPAAKEDFSTREMSSHSSQTNNNNDENNQEREQSNNGKKHAPNEKNPTAKMASIADTLGLVFECGGRVGFLFFLGSFSAVLHGLVFPALAYLFSNSFSDIAGVAENGLAGIRELAYAFMVVGVYALGTATAQTWSFELVAYHAGHNFRLKVSEYCLFVVDGPIAILCQLIRSLPSILDSCFSFYSHII